MLNIMKCQSIRSLQCIQYMEKCYYLYLANVFRYHISPFSLAFWQLLFPLDCKGMQKYTRTISFFKVLISMRYSFSMLINHLYFTLKSESDGKTCLLFCQMNFISKLRLTLWNAYVSSNMIEAPLSQNRKICRKSHSSTIHSKSLRIQNSNITETYLIRFVLFDRSTQRYIDDSCYVSGDLCLLWSQSQIKLLQYSQCICVSFTPFW